MSFFRVLLALLISGGIAYGLYAATGGTGIDRVVEAVRTRIADPAERTASVPAPVAEADAGDAAIAPMALADGTPEAPAANDARAEDAPMVLSEGTAPDDGGETAQAGDAPMALAEGTPVEGDARDDDEQMDEASADEGRMALADDAATGDEADDDALATTTEDGETAPRTDGPTFAERVAESVAAGPDLSAAPADVGTETETETTGGNDLPRIAVAPVPSETALPDDAQAPEALRVENLATQAPRLQVPSVPATLPAARIAATTDTTTDALDVINSGMRYVEARRTMIAAGWTPRQPATRATGPNEAENAMIRAGYGEVEGCKGDERPICRFEFVDGDKRIAAVLTAGTGTDPSVIDAFLMTIRAE